MRRLYQVLLVFLLLVSNHLFAQCPPNIGFEDGTFTNWLSAVGNIALDGNITMGIAGAAVANRQTLMGPNGVSDPFGHFPTLCPNGGKYSVRLGNSDTGHQAERLSYTYKVPKGDGSTLILNYAVVLQNPVHIAIEQPRFTVKVHDITDNTDIACPAFDFIASPSLPGFKLSDVAAPNHSTDSVYYKEWTTTTINLEAYVGKEVRLDFTTNDCAPGGHFGYAYFDLDENCTPGITGNSYCNGQPGITLTAPIGFNKYIWYKASDLNNPIGTGLKLNLSPAPPDLSQLALVILPYPGLGCIDTLYTTVNRVGEDFKLAVADTVYGCTNSGADLTAPSVTAGSSPGMIYSYYTDSLATTYLVHPQSVGEGTYYIKGVSSEGCLNVLPVHVLLRNAPV